MKVLFTSVILLTILSAISSFAAENPISLVMEAEDFQPAPGSGWKPMNFGENYFQCCIGTAYFSGEKLLSAPEKCSPSKAQTKVRIPADGKYRAWVHFESPKDYNVRFGLLVEQGGKTVLDAPMGGAEQLKLWPLNWGYQAQVDPYYGGGDNVAWQGAEVELLEGEATFTLYTRDNPEPAAKRNIDVVYLTSDLSDQPKDKIDPFLNELPRPGRLYIRFTNTGSEPIKPFIGAIINRRNWRAPEEWASRTDQKALENPIPPGGSSPWMDIGAQIDTIHGTTLEIRPGGDRTTFGAKVEIAHSPDAAERWTYKWERDEIPLFVWVPVDLDIKAIGTSDQIRKRIEGYLADVPETEVPNKIKFCAALLGPHSERDHRHGSWIDLFYKLGYNTPMGSPNRDTSEWRQILGGDMSRRVVGVTHTDPGANPDKLKEEWASPELAESRGHLDVFSIGDEISLSAYGGNEKDTLPDKLRAAGFTLEQLGVKDWSEATGRGDGTAFQHPILFVEGIKYGYERSIRNMAKLTSAITKAFDGKISVAANYAPHPAFLPDEWQWVDVFKNGGLTMPWTEDYHWQVPVISSQIIGYTLDVMRCGAKYHDLPMQYYCMPHSPGNTDTDFRLSNYLALGRGVKYINHFSIGPQLFATENYVDWRDKSRYREIHSIIREAGKVDDLLYVGKPPKAEVAVMLCRYTDIWEKFGPTDTSGKRKHEWTYNAYGVERQGVWLALKHAQVPVELITDPDVCEGRLAQYKVLYLVGSHISGESALKIKDWVRSGGTLFASAAGGLYDEYNRPLDTLHPVYGISSHNFRQADWLIRAKQELPRLKPIEVASLTIGKKPAKMECLAVTDHVKMAPESKALGKFKDGTPAVLENSFGKGRAYLVNSMVGLAYQKSALPLRPFDRGEFAHFLPRTFSKDILNLISLPLQQAGVTKRVECSNPLVEGDALESAQGIVISLANFSGTPQRKLTVKVRPARPVSSVWSARQGNLSYKAVEGAIVVETPVDVTDFLVIQ